MHVLIYYCIFCKRIRKLLMLFLSSRGATVEIVFKNSYFTAYKSGSIVNLHSLIGKL